MPVLPGRLPATTMLVLASVGYGQRLSVEIIPMSAVDLAFPVLRDGRQSSIESRSLQLLTTGEDGSNLRELLLFREPATGQVLFLVRILRNNFFGTHAEAGDLLQNTAVSIDKSSMRAFFFVGYSLLISESKVRAASLDAAQELALSDLAASNHPYPGQTWWVTDEHWIRLLEGLPKSLAEHVSEPRVPPTHLRELARSGRCWSMTIDGPNAESTRIAIDDNYDLTSIESCAKPRRSVAHIILSSSETKLQVPALRNNRPARLELRSLLAAVTFPDGQSGRLNLLMLYDPRSRPSGGLAGFSIPQNQIQWSRPITKTSSVCIPYSLQTIGSPFSQVHPLVIPPSAIPISRLPKLTSCRFWSEYVATFKPAAAGSARQPIV